MQFPPSHSKMHHGSWEIFSWVQHIFDTDTYSLTATNHDFLDGTTEIQNMILKMNGATAQPEHIGMIKNYYSTEEKAGFIWRKNCKIFFCYYWMPIAQCWRSISVFVRCKNSLAIRNIKLHETKWKKEIKIDLCVFLRGFSLFGTVKRYLQLSTSVYIVQNSFWSSVVCYSAINSEFRKTHTCIIWFCKQIEQKRKMNIS